MSERRVPQAYAGAAKKAPRSVLGGQVVAEVPPEGVVVFLIGMRVNRWRRIRTWWPAFVAMPRMLAELHEADRGLLGARTYWSGRDFLVVQYWRSAADLGAYARDPGMKHAPAWGAFNRAGAARGDVGIYHETYVVGPDAIESLYGNMPIHGLAAARGYRARSEYRRTTEANRQLQTSEPTYVVDQG